MISASDDLDTTAIALGACSLQMFRPLDLIIDSAIESSDDRSNSVLEGACKRAIESEIDGKL
jgi:hypothetical protein